jgi:hypothetical protein
MSMLLGGGIATSLSTAGESSEGDDGCDFVEIAASSALSLVGGIVSGISGCGGGDMPTLRGPFAIVS